MACFSTVVSLFTVCFIGACAGSTTSGIKIVHYVILWKQLKHELTKFFVHPGFIRSIRLSGQKLDERLIQIAFAYFFLNILLVLAGACVMGMLNDIDFETAISSTISALMNIGPGFGAVGPTDNYHHLSEVSKWILSWLMLVGRLELFTALVIFYPSFWKNGSSSL